MIGATSFVAIQNAQRDPTGRTAAAGIAGLLLAVVLIAIFEIVDRRRRSCPYCHSRTRHADRCPASGDLRAYFEKRLGRQLPPPNPDAKNSIPR